MASFERGASRESTAMTPRNMLRPYKKARGLFTCGFSIVFEMTVRHNFRWAKISLVSMDPLNCPCGKHMPIDPSSLDRKTLSPKITGVAGS
jgi:hypothetical protein